MEQCETIHSQKQLFFLKETIRMTRKLKDFCSAIFIFI